MKRALLFVIAACLWAPLQAKAGYETAPYTVERNEKEFEIRSYPALKVATTTGQKDADGSFMKLFRYIDGANVDSQKIAMTTPVFMEGKTMTFVLPAAVAAGAPAPKAEDVQIIERPAARYAVYRFKGWRSAKNEAAALEKIKGWMQQQGLAANGEASFAYYDPPWTLGPFRRNEVLIPIP